MIKEQNIIDGKTAELIGKLASKLGTTTEYLWGVLLQQAPVAALTTLVQCLLIVIFGVILWKIHKRLLQNAIDGYECSYYEKYELSAQLPMTFGLIIFVVGVLDAFFSVDTIVNGFFNPEYWALQQVLKAIN